MDLLETFDETFKTPYQSPLDKYQPKSFSMALNEAKRGQKQKWPKWSNFKILLQLSYVRISKMQKLSKNSYSERLYWHKNSTLYYCGLNVFLTKFAKWHLLWSDFKARQNFLKLSCLEGFDECPQEQFSHLKVNTWILARLCMALQIWMPHPVLCQLYSSCTFDN